MKKRVQPQVNALLIADDVRIEVGNKISVMGVYTNEIIFSAGSKPEALMLPTLVVLLILSDGEGKFETALSFLDPDSAPMFESAPQTAVVSRNSPANMLIKIAPVHFKKTGDYKVIAKVGMKEYQRKITVKIARPSIE